MLYHGLAYLMYLYIIFQSFHFERIYALPKVNIPINNSQDCFVLSPLMILLQNIFSYVFQTESLYNQCIIFHCWMYFHSTKDLFVQPTLTQVMSTPSLLTTLRFCSLISEKVTMSSFQKDNFIVSVSQCHYDSHFVHFFPTTLLSL